MVYIYINMDKELINRLKKLEVEEIIWLILIEIILFYIALSDEGIEIGNLRYFKVI